MNRSLCDEVMMHAPLTESGRTNELPPHLAAHVEICPECAELLRTKAALRQLVETTRMDPIAKRRLEVRILARAQGNDRRDSRVFARLSAPLTALFSVVLLASVASTFLTPAAEMRVSTETMETVADADKAARAAEPAAIAPKIIETPDRDEKVTLTQGAALWLDRGTTIEVLSDNQKLAKTRVKTGRLVVDIAKHPPGFRFVVETPSAEVEALGTVFSVFVSPRGEETVRVVESAVVVRPKNGTETAVVRAGEQLQLGISPPMPADETELADDLRSVRGIIDTPELTDSPAFIDADLSFPAEVDEKPARALRSSAVEEAVSAETIIDAIEAGRLSEAERLLRRTAPGSSTQHLQLFFKLAGAYRSRRDYRQTVSVYEQVLSAYPERDAAINTLVSIGQLKQGFLKDPAGALFYYDRYLRKRPHGLLAEVAAAGKLRALYSLRQWEDVIVFSAEYLRSFPSGISTAEVLQKRERAMKMTEGR